MDRRSKDPEYQMHENVTDPDQTPDGNASRPIGPDAETAQDSDSAWAVQQRQNRSHHGSESSSDAGNP